MKDVIFVLLTFIPTGPKGSRCASQYKVDNDFLMTKTKYNEVFLPAWAVKVTNSHFPWRDIQGEHKPWSHQPTRRKGQTGSLQLLGHRETNPVHWLGRLAWRHHNPNVVQANHEQWQHNHQQQQHHGARSCGVDRTRGLSAEQRQDRRKTGNALFIYPPRGDKRQGYAMRDFSFVFEIVSLT